MSGVVVHPVCCSTVRFDHDLTAHATHHHHEPETKHADPRSLITAARLDMVTAWEIAENTSVWSIKPALPLKDKTDGFLWALVLSFLLFLSSFHICHFWLILGLLHNLRRDHRIRINWRNCIVKTFVFWWGLNCILLDFYLVFPRINLVIASGLSDQFWAFRSISGLVYRLLKRIAIPLVRSGTGCGAFLAFRE